MKKCPVCKSSDVTYYMGFQFGKYQCKKCSYTGSLVIDDSKNTDGKTEEMLKDLKRHSKQ